MISHEVHTRQGLLLAILKIALHINPKGERQSILSLKTGLQTNTLDRQKLETGKGLFVGVWEGVVECRWFGEIGRWEIEKWPQDGQFGNQVGSGGRGEGGQAGIAFKQTDPDLENILDFQNIF